MINIKKNLWWIIPLIIIVSFFSLTGGLLFLIAVFVFMRRHYNELLKNIKKGNVYMKFDKMDRGILYGYLLIKYKTFNMKIAEITLNNTSGNLILKIHSNIIDIKDMRKLVMHMFVDYINKHGYSTFKLKEKEKPYIPTTLFQPYYGYGIQSFNEVGDTRQLVHMEYNKDHGDYGDGYKPPFGYMDIQGENNSHIINIITEKHILMDNKKYKLFKIDISHKNNSYTTTLNAYISRPGSNVKYIKLTIVSEDSRTFDNKKLPASITLNEDITITDNTTRNIIIYILSVIIKNESIFNNIKDININNRSVETDNNTISFNCKIEKINNRIDFIMHSYITNVIE
jgi:hypothetical protein